MVAAIKIRIKFGPQGYVKTFQTFPSINNGGNAKKFEHSVGEDLFNSADQSKKRRRKEQDGFQEKKKQKLDSEMSSQCLTLLNLLMEDRAGWLFNTPVDPVKLEIPDYFSVISKPMDLGTVKSKLLKNEYNNADEFAADVRLTFTNSMLYNPPGNMIHEVAKKIKEGFEVRWKFLNKKAVLKQSPHEISDSSVELTKPVKEKSEKVSLSSKPVNGQSKTKTPAVTPKATARKSINNKLDQGRGVSSTAEVPKKGRIAACECGSCGRMVCICLKYNYIGSVSCSLMDSQVKNTSGSGSQASKLDPNCNGSVSSRNEYHELETPTPALPPLPPEKAVRAAILKCKYAETILKAKQKIVPNQSNKADRLGLQIEKEKMEKTQREEIARIEAEIRAAKIASRKKAQAELKQKRERQRLEIEKMKKDFDFERHNHHMVEKDFVSVCGCTTLKRTWMLKLGLVLRNDECPELEEIGSETSDAIRVEDLEEGELI